MSEPRPKTIGSGPAQVGATAAIAAGWIEPFPAARRAIVAAWPPPKITNSPSAFSESIITNTDKLIPK